MSTILLAGVLTAGSASAGEHAARLRLCPENLPDGVRLPAQAGCGAAASKTKPQGLGFRDFGNGTSVRIGGRVGAEYGIGGR